MSRTTNTFADPAVEQEKFIRLTNNMNKHLNRVVTRETGRHARQGKEPIKPGYPP